MPITTNVEIPVSPFFTCRSISGACWALLFAVTWGERIGWHWGFGAAGIGMLVGVIQFVYFRSQLGTAGLNPNEMAEGRRSTLRLWTIITVLFFAAVVISGVLGLWSIDPVFLPNVFVTF